MLNSPAIFAALRDPLALMPALATVALAVIMALTSVARAVMNAA
ncbi:hypothetical protein AB0B48_14655 [Micromonospora sp. NPDC049089]